MPCQGGEYRASVLRALSLGEDGLYVGDNAEYWGDSLPNRRSGGEDGGSGDGAEYRGDSFLNLLQFSIAEGLG